MPVSTPTQPATKRLISTYLRVQFVHRGLIVYRVHSPGWHALVAKSREGRTIGFAIVTGRVCWEFKWGRS